MKAHFVLDVGEILVCCVRCLIFLTDRGPAVLKEHSCTGHESPGGLHVARLHHPLTRAVTQHSSHSAASLMRNKRGILLDILWRASEMLAFPVAYRLCHSNDLGLHFDFLPLSQPSRRWAAFLILIRVIYEYSNVPAKERGWQPALPNCALGGHFLCCPNFCFGHGRKPVLSFLLFAF